MAFENKDTLEVILRRNKKQSDNKMRKYLLLYVENFLFQSFHYSHSSILR